MHFFRRKVYIFLQKKKESVFHEEIVKILPLHHPTCHGSVIQLMFICHLLAMSGKELCHPPVPSATRGLGTCSPTATSEIIVLDPPSRNGWLVRLCIGESRNRSQELYQLSFCGHFKESIASDSNACKTTAEQNRLFHWSLLSHYKVVCKTERKEKDLWSLLLYCKVVWERT